MISEKVGKMQYQPHPPHNLCSNLASARTQKTSAPMLLFYAPAWVQGGFFCGLKALFPSNQPSDLMCAFYSAFVPCPAEEAGTPLTPVWSHRRATSFSFFQST